MTGCVSSRTAHRRAVTTPEHANEHKLNLIELVKWSQDLVKATIEYPGTHTCTEEATPVGDGVNGWYQVLVSCALYQIRTNPHLHRSHHERLLLMCLRRLSYAAKAPRRSRARDLENAGYVEVMCVPLRYRPPRHERPRGSAAATPTITARRSTAF